jgi:hypothetical protein
MVIVIHISAKIIQKANTKSNGVIIYNGFFDTLKKIYISEGFTGLYKGKFKN